MNCYCANSSGGTVLSDVFGMARTFFNFFLGLFLAGFRDPFYQLPLAWQDFFKDFLEGRLTRWLPLSRSNELPVDVAQLPSARFCETAI